MSSLTATDGINSEMYFPITALTCRQPKMTANLASQSKIFPCKQHNFHISLEPIKLTATSQPHWRVPIKHINIRCNCNAVLSIAKTTSTSSLRVCHLTLCSTLLKMLIVCTIMLTFSINYNTGAFIKCQ